MHNNFYFLKHLSKQLKSDLVGYKVGEIYSQQKNELTICFYTKGADYNIKAHLDSEFSCLYFPENVSRARRNSVDLFVAIKDLEVLDIVQIEQDRSFYFLLENDFILLFKLHGNRSNIILMQGGGVIEIFRKNLKQDLEIDLTKLSKTIDPSLENFKIQHGMYKNICPTFGKTFDPYFKDQGYDSLSVDRQYVVFSNLLESLNNPDYFIHTEDGKKPQLLLYQQDVEDQVFHDPKLALNKLFKSYVSIYRLQHEKLKIQNRINEQIKKGEAYIRKSKTKLDQLQTAESYAHIGDLIMANLHQIKSHESEVTLTDFYTKKPVVVKLKPTLSPQLNAEKYYKKSKKQQLEIDNLEKNISVKLDHISKLKNELKRLEEVKKLKHLKPGKEVLATNSDQPFHKTTYMDHEILIGKNAKKNEQLTFGLAGKDDLFLHAKDSPGSHVIIRRKSNQNFPEKVIETAASYAAYYSKSSQDSLIRVLYTPKKYVRKAKGAPPGAVFISQEKVVLVKPMPLKK